MNEYEMLFDVEQDEKRKGERSMASGELHRQQPCVYEVAAAWLARSSQAPVGITTGLSLHQHVLNVSLAARQLPRSCQVLPDIHCGSERLS